MLKWTNEVTCSGSCLWKPCKEIPSNSAISFIARSPRKPASLDAPLRVLPSPMERVGTACQQRSSTLGTNGKPSYQYDVQHWLKAAWGQHGLTVDPRGPERGGWQLAYGNPFLNEGWEGDILWLPHWLSHAFPWDHIRWSTPWISVLLTPPLWLFAFFNPIYSLLFMMWPCRTSPEVWCINGRAIHISWCDQPKSAGGWFLFACSLDTRVILCLGRRSLAMHGDAYNPSGEPGLLGLQTTPTPYTRCSSIYANWIK